MDSALRASLRSLLCSYLGEFNFETSADELAFETQDDPGQQRAWIDTLDGGIAAAAQRDEDVPILIRDGPGGALVDANEAKAILEKIRAAYLAALVRDNAKPDGDSS